MSSESTVRSVDMAQARFVGFWMRVLAFVIDSVWILLAMFFLLPLLGLSFEEAASLDLSTLPRGETQLWQHLTSLDSPFLDPKHTLGNFGIPMLIVVACWLISSTTPAKQLLGMRIVDMQTGRDIGLWQSVLRYVGYFLSGLVFGVGFIWVLISRRKRGWHDMLAGTAVVYTR